MVIDSKYVISSHSSTDAVKRMTNATERPNIMTNVCPSWITRTPCPICLAVINHPTKSLAAVSNFYSFLFSIRY